MVNLQIQHLANRMPNPEVPEPSVVFTRKSRSFLKTLGPAGSVAILVLVLLVVAAVFGPSLWVHGAFDQQVEDRLQLPSFAHPLGTDPLGRDILARLLLGARWSLAGALLVCIGVNVIGFAVGALSAFGPKSVDTTLGRLVELLMALPWLVTALAIASVLGPAFSNLCIALIVTSWPWYARTYRTLLLRERSALYVESCQCIGASPWRTVMHHVLPNVAGPTIVLMTANLGSAMLSLTSFSFLGMGVQPPTPEWGMMVNDARTFFQRQPWQMIAPGLCVVAAALAVNIAGDALRDLVDPRSR